MNASAKLPTNSVVRVVAVLTIGAVAVATVVLKVRDIAIIEANISSWLIHVTGLANSRAVGTAVVYQLGQRWVGFTITGGCSVALLMIPPFILTTILIGIRRVTLGRGLVAAACATGLLVTVNQIRLFIIASSMQWWGFQTGYERSHVLIGSAITTIGLALATIIFLVFLARQPRLRQGRARHAV